VAKKLKNYIVSVRMSQTHHALVMSCRTKAEAIRKFKEFDGDVDNLGATDGEIYWSTIKAEEDK